MNNVVELVEVGPRDGLQGVHPFVPTETKVRLVESALRAGVGRIEIGSLVSNRAVPQMRDTPDLVNHIRSVSSTPLQILVPTRKYGDQALVLPVDWIAYVVSASQEHNHANLRRNVFESVDDFLSLADMAPERIRLRLNIATSFDCPFKGSVAIEDVTSILAATSAYHGRLEICFCDTTGRANPAQVAKLFDIAQGKYSTVHSWAFHAHDTYGMGLANVYAAYLAGVRTFDAAFAGLGGCPFAPGATGNVATEDVAYMFDSMGIGFKMDLDALVQSARLASAIPGAVTGGRVRQALTSATTARRGS